MRSAFDDIEGNGLLHQDDIEDLGGEGGEEGDEQLARKLQEKELKAMER